VPAWILIAVKPQEKKILNESDEHTVGYVLVAFFTVLL